MALRSIAVMRDIVDDMERRCPDAWLVNYTNPVNIVSEAITHQSPIRCVSLCEGPLVFPAGIARLAGLDPSRLDATLVGLNHTGWTVRHLYDGADVMPLITEADERQGAPATRGERMLHLAAVMGALGCRQALLLDGGISGQLLVREATGSVRTWPGTRSVPLGLVGRVRR